MKFIDTADKLKEREAIRERIRRIQAKEAEEIKLRKELRIQNRKIGQISLSETTLGTFGVKHSSRSRQDQTMRDVEPEKTTGKKTTLRNFGLRGKKR